MSGSAGQIVDRERRGGHGGFEPRALINNEYQSFLVISSACLTESSQALILSVSIVPITGCIFAGCRSRIRTFDLLMLSLSIGIKLASRVLSVRWASVDRRLGVSQVPIPKCVRCPSRQREEAVAVSGRGRFYR